MEMKYNKMVKKWPFLVFVEQLLIERKVKTWYIHDMLTEEMRLEDVLATGLIWHLPSLTSLLKEAEFHAEQREHELNRRRQLGVSSSHHSLDNADFDNKDDDKHDQRLLSQFGIWFLVSKRS